MKKIPSFTIDHIRLLRGIYISRQDEVNGETVTTFDIRMKEPNREPALGQGALHTIEHLAATYLPMAKWESAKYLHEVLEQMKEENMKYPEKEEK